MAGLVNTNVITQVGIIVKDIEKSKKKWAEFLGVPVPPLVNSGEYGITKTRYKGKGAPRAACTMAFFNVGGNLQLELIQPNGEKSTWQEHLDRHGEGVHHVAFQVKGMDRIIEACGEAGLKCVQRGNYGDASGEYAYLDGSKDLKCVIELLESFGK